MKTVDIQNGQICEGDYIKDGGEYRKVTGFTIHNEWTLYDSTVHFDDGGLMGIVEVTSDKIYLESEVNG